MLEELQAGRSRPCALDCQIADLGAHELAYPRLARISRQDFQHERRHCHFLARRFEIERFVFVTHRRCCYAQRSVVESADQRIGVDAEPGRSEFLRERADLTTRGDCRKIVKIHADKIFAALLAMAHDSRLATFHISAIAGRVRHLHHLETDEGLVDFQRLGHNSDKRITIGAVGDVEVFAISEAMRPFHKCRRSDGGRVLLCNILFLHRRRSPYSASVIYGAKRRRQRPYLRQLVSVRRCALNSAPHRDYFGRGDEPWHRSVSSRSSSMVRQGSQAVSSLNIWSGARERKTRRAGPSLAAARRSSRKSALLSTHEATCRLSSPMRPIPPRCIRWPSALRSCSPRLAPISSTARRSSKPASRGAPVTSICAASPAGCARLSMRMRRRHARAARAS